MKVRTKVLEEAVKNMIKDGDCDKIKKAHQDLKKLKQIIDNKVEELEVLIIEEAFIASNLDKGTRQQIKEN